MAKKIEQSTEYVSRNVETNNGDDDEEVITFTMLELSTVY